MMILLTIIALFAALLHGLAGMGFPLVATSVLALAMPLSKAVALLALPTLLINLWVVLAKPSLPNQAPNPPIQIRPYLPLIIVSVIGGILGVKLLLVLPTVWLTLLLGMTILCSSLHGLIALKTPNKNNSLSKNQSPTLIPMLITGFLAGVIGTATNAMSPILLFYLFKQSDDKLLISKVSNICYLLSKILQIILLWQAFLTFHKNDWILLLVLCVVAILGVMIGTHYQKKISPLRFKQMIYGILLLLAIKMLWSSIGALS